MKLTTAMRLARRKLNSSFQPDLPHTALADLGANIVSSKTAKTPSPIGLLPMLPSSHPLALVPAIFHNVVKTTWVKALAMICLVKTAA